MPPPQRTVDASPRDVDVRVADENRGASPAAAGSSSRAMGDLRSKLSYLSERSEGHNICTQSWFFGPFTCADKTRVYYDGTRRPIREVVSMKMAPFCCNWPCVLSSSWSWAHGRTVELMVTVYFAHSSELSQRIACALLSTLPGGTKVGESWRRSLPRQRKQVHFAKPEAIQEWMGIIDSGPLP